MKRSRAFAGMTCCALVVSLCGAAAALGQPGSEKPINPKPAPEKPKMPEKPAIPGKPTDPAKPGDKPAAPGKDGNGMPDMSDPAQLEAMMKEAEKLAAPGEHHKQLEKFVGTWDTEVNVMMMPDQKTKGKSVVTSVLGGRFIHTQFKGEFMGQPFEGAGLWGYNNTKQQYESTWSDTMSTHIMLATGTCSADHKTYTLKAEFEDPMMGKVQHREVVTWTGPDTYKMEMFHAVAGGPEEKVMEIAYTRAKGASGAAGGGATKDEKKPAGH